MNQRTPYRDKTPFQQTLSSALMRAFPQDKAAADKAEATVMGIIQTMTGPVATTTQHVSPTPSRGQTPNPADAVALLANVARAAHELSDDNEETDGPDGESGFFVKEALIVGLSDALDTLDMLAEPDPQALVPGYMRAEHWAQAGSPYTIEGLNPATAKLVADFAYALALKLRKAQDKYGYSDGWAEPDWMHECREALVNHVAKGDPLDVAAYCAFLHFHGQPTRLPPAVSSHLSIDDA